MKLSGLLAGGLLLLVPSVASAWPQQRDYFLDAPRAGNFVHADVFTAGIQATIEKRIALEDENLGMFHMRANAVGSLGFGDFGVHTDLRFLGLFTIGGSVGYRRVWQNYSWERTTPNNRDTRNAKLDDKDNVRGPKGVSWPWLEARARMVIPLEPLWLVSNFAVRWESPGDLSGAQDSSGMPNNAFDWFHTNVHDPGRLMRLDATLFYRHKSFGGIGPTIRYMDLPRNNVRESELAYGITFGTRPGAFAKDDLFLVQTLFDFNDKGKSFGWHVGPLYKIPMYAMIIYRKSFEL